MGSDEPRDLAEVRRELADVFDRIAALAPDDVVERGRLRIRHDELVDVLGDAAATTPAEHRWAVRPRQPDDHGAPYVPSAGEGGGEVS